jgi:2-oxoglutarate/2-oxoacid ferredoxin oxidoreductase subunit alpha
MGEKLLMKGNEVIAEAALRAGCRHYFGYPITPQTEIAHYFAKKCLHIMAHLFKPRAKLPP